MKFNRIISTFLALVMVFGVLTFIPHTTSAATVTAGSAGKLDEDGNPIIQYTAKRPENPDDIYETREEKLRDMLKIKSVNGLTIYYEAFTGEVAFVNDNTGDILFTNPYDVSKSNASEDVKVQLLSQIHLTYLDNGDLKEMWSYEEAAERQQITMVEIKNGIRVEYKIGEPAIQRLTPRMISVERFNKYIKEPIEDIIAQIKAGTYMDGNYDKNDFDIVFAWGKFKSYYELKDIDAPNLSERAIKEMESAYPVVKQFPIYVCDTKVSAHELEILENLVKKCCPNYTYEELDFDNQQCGFKNEDQIPPRFAMALEYRITDTGVEVTLPANGISFDETLYQLQDVTVLPFMGAGNSDYEGYTFLPDGSGAIFRYEDLKDTICTISGQMYGQDFAYHEIKGQNTQTFRFPVFGAVTNYTKPLMQADACGYNDSGFLAVITQGDSLATLTTNHGGALHEYNSVYATFTPRPSDSYTIADTTGGGTGASFTVTSDRRYTGSYKINYIMLGEGTGYEASYVGMAEAYRDYLSGEGVITKKTQENTDKKLPLFIESFGSTTGTEKVLSFPVTVDVPLTTFEDIKTMTNELSEKGISNLSFKLTGFANGGLESTAPIKLSWQDVLGGSSGLEDLVAFADEKDIGLFPEFDFAYLNARSTFDGVNLKSDAVKTIDGRYIRKQVYDSGFQEFVSVGGAAISASVFSKYWSKFSDKFLSYNIGGISLATLGTDLNSDFDKDDPYHREDNKAYTADMLANVANNNSVMVAGGNAYTLKYATVITDVALTSSEYINASEAVPFTGIVLHGSKDFTGTPMNMEGDISEAILNAIENGASMFLTLSYRNTQVLSDDEFWSKYYSVDYSIWKDDVVKYYNILNDNLAEVQTSYIVDHEFIDATRTPDADETAEDIAKIDAYNAAQSAKLEAAQKSYDIKLARYQRLGDTDAIAKLGARPAETDFAYRLIDITDFEKALLEYNSKMGITVDRYEIDKGSVVYVEYEGGVAFVLNYNSFAVNVEVNGELEKVEPISFIKLDVKNS